MELFGTSLAFHSLEILSIKHMSRWEKWSTNSGVVFPCLQELHIEFCGNLVEVSLETLPPLNVLEIGSCDSGVLRRLVEIATSVKKLEKKCILGLNDVVWRGVMGYLGALEDLRIMNCNEIRYLWESKAIASKLLVKLRNLDVSCDNLLSLGEEEDDNCLSNLLTYLRMLTVYLFVQIALGVYSCSSITTISLPTGGQKVKSFEVKNYGWRNLKSLNYSVQLIELRITGCGSLESFPDNELANLTLLKKLEIVQGTPMQANVLKRWFPLFEHLLKDTGCYFIVKPTIERNNSRNKYVADDNKIGIYNDSKVYLYVIGFVADIDEILDVWANKEKSGLIVVILQFGTLKYYQRSAYMNNAFNVSKLFINSEIDEITDFKNSLLQNSGLSTCSVDSSKVSGTFMSLFDEYVVNIEFNNTAEVNLSKVKHVVIVATVELIPPEIPWYYQSCKTCNRKLTKINDGGDISDTELVDQHVLYECKTVGCNPTAVPGSQRLKIPLTVQDSTGTLSLTLFDREATKLLEKKCVKQQNF
ncbi:hypothetical protein L1987_03139 [Smallanthus sonchifolius]|uniref:Uncharacterized protein n=1 Tax=Smallanthus sonchifolius TaxID=185202 RepID=A0ACB9KA09_9ASTR|nr:hypothetical protein L1987_03139 [Smallanthus sonchifolius]